MAYNRAQAQKLCTTTELELFVASLPDEVVKLTAAKLQGKVKRARALRDKNVDLFRRQTASIRSTTGTKRGSTGVANVRTQQKANLFGEVLKRFEARLAKLQTQAAKAEAGKKAPVKAVSKAPAKKAVVAKPAAKKPATAKTAAAPKPAKKPVVKPAAKAPAAKKVAAKPAAKKAAAKPVAKTTKAAKPVSVKSVTKAVAKAAAAPKATKPAVPARSTKAPAARAPSVKGPAVKRETEISKTVKVRGKTIGAHQRKANARGEAKRGSR